MPSRCWPVRAIMAACILCHTAAAADATRLHGKALPRTDGCIELLYDWSDPAQLRDWQADTGAPPTLAGGELRFGGRRALHHVATFTGDVEVSGTWCVREALGSEASCGVGLHVTPTGDYTLILKAKNQRVYKHRGTNVLRWAKADCPNAVPHTFRFARVGRSVKAWIDDNLCIDLTDPDHDTGTIRLSAWNAHVAYAGIRIAGRLDPQWLAAHPGAARLLESATQEAKAAEHVAQARSKLLSALRPLWARRAYHDALEIANKACSAAKGEAEKEALRPCQRAAELLARLWQGVRVGAGQTLGKTTRIKGIAGRVTGVDDDYLVLKTGAGHTRLKLTTLSRGKLLAFAHAGLDPEAAETRLAAGLFLAFDNKPDLESARWEFDAAKKAGADAEQLLGLATTPPGVPSQELPSAQALRNPRPPDLPATKAARRLPAKDQAAADKLSKRVASEWRLAVAANPGDLGSERERAKALACLQHINKCLALCKKLLAFLDARKGLECDRGAIRNNMQLLELWRKDLAARYDRALR